ncbi:hypothetical protein ACGFRG_36320 [Streptomyces sp. NPDC048696]|uniref:hypothetical protein n=1 Tax=Streptomyces sp. NPDC048696 TaxID=3365585 RepID=UPI00371495B7
MASPARSDLGTFIRTHVGNCARTPIAWPEQFCQGATWPWQAIAYAGNASIPGITLTDEQAAVPGHAIPAPAGDPDLEQHEAS